MVELIIYRFIDTIMYMWPYEPERYSNKEIFDLHVTF